MKSLTIWIIILHCTNGLGETSAQNSGKLNTFAYNIGTSLNKEAISKQRQLITPTAQMLESLSQEETSPLALKLGFSLVFDGTIIIIPPNK